MKEKITIKDLLNYRFPENLQYNPSGTVAAFQVAYADPDHNSYHRDIWLIRDGQAARLTSAADSTIIFWLDDQTLIISRHAETDTPGTTVLYTMNIGGGEAMPWLTLPFPLLSMKKVTADIYAVVAPIEAGDPDAYLDTPEKRAEKQAAAKEAADYEVLDEVPYWSNSANFINKKRTALFLVETRPALKIRRITAPLFDLSCMITDGRTIYYTGNIRKARFSLYEHIYACDAVTRKVRTLYGRDQYRLSELFIMKGQLYVMATDMKAFGVEETPSFSRVENGKLTLLSKVDRSLFCSVSGDTMLGGGKSHAEPDDLITLVTEEDHVEIWSFDRQLKPRKLLSRPGAIHFLDASRDTILFAATGITSPAEIYAMDRKDGHVRQITRLNTEAVKGRYVARPIPLSYRSDDLDLKGWVLLPQGFDRKKKYPAVLDIHGGPRAVYGENFFHEMQVWAAEGYVVFFTNIAGSDGRGDSFADIRGKYGEIDYRNLMDFTDAVLKKYPNIDPQRVCETGGSYGGYMTNWIIGHTDRFCCTASQRSIANWMSFCFISDIGLWFGTDQNGIRSPFGAEEALWAHSPLKYADKAKTPTLFIHSDLDRRCPIPEGYQMMQALTYNGVETRMVVFHGETHELSRSGRPLHRIRRLQEITDWFNRFAR